MSTLNIEKFLVKEDFKELKSVVGEIQSVQDGIESMKEVASQAQSQMQSQMQMPTATRSSSVSREFRGLLINFAATQTDALSLDEVNWSMLAKSLGAKVEFVAEAAQIAEQENGLWVDVMAERIRRVGAARVFRDFTWERVESGALNFLSQLLEKNLIRDPGELLAIAEHARRINVSQGQPSVGGNNVQINIGDSVMSQNGLPASGSRMTIDLSPRLANSLNSTRPESTGNRVIDGEMIGAKELRSVLEQATEAESDSNEGETNE